MVLRKYVKNELTYSDLQFAISIALDDLQEVAAAKVVLSFLRPISDNTGFNSILVQREELEKELKDFCLKNHCDLLQAILQYYFTNPVFLTKSKSSRTKEGVSKCTLRSLVKVVSEDSLYEYVMQMMANTNRSALIAKYTTTTMFKEQFVRFIKREELEHHHFSGKINDQAMDQLLEEFTEWISKNSSNGSYVTQSCNPDAFLFKRTDGSGTDQGAIVWFQKDPSTDYYKILNSSGSYSDVDGTDGISKIDSIGLTSDIEEQDDSFIGLNFIDWCSKIQAASSVLFSHASESVLYYDIFSYYRNKLIKNDYERFSKMKCYGFSLSFAEQASDICGENPTLTGKFNSHTPICDIFEKMLTMNLSLVDIPILYDEVIRFSKELANLKSGKKDGKLLFSVEGHNVKATGSGNGERFLILLHGYLALRELLGYLERNQEELHVNVYNFPVDIFRYPDLLNRVHSIEEYLAYGKEIKQLYLSALEDSSAPKVDGLWENSHVYSILQSNHKFRFDATVIAFSTTPIAVIQEALKEFNQGPVNVADMIRNLDYDIESILGSFFTVAQKNYGFSSLDDLFDLKKLRKLSIVKINDFSNWIAKNIIYYVTNRCKESDMGDLFENKYLWLLIGLFSLALRAASEKIGDKLVMEANGKYLIKDKDLLHSVWITDAYEKATGKNPGELLKTRMKAIALSRAFMLKDINALLKLSKVVDDGKRLGAFNLSREEYFDFWYVSTKIAKYVSETRKTLKYLHSCGGDYGLCLLYAIQNLDFFHISRKITSVEQLEALDDNKSPTLFIEYDDTKQFKAMISRQNKVLLEVFNNMLGTFKHYIDIYEILLNSVHVYFKNFSSKRIQSDVNERDLIEGLISIASLKLVGDKNLKIARRLAVVADFDSKGFVVKNLKRFYILDKNKTFTRKFVHQDGFFVEVSEWSNRLFDEGNGSRGNNTVNVTQITDEDFEMIVGELMGPY